MPEKFGDVIPFPRPKKTESLGAVAASAEVAYQKTRRWKMIEYGLFGLTLAGVGISLPISFFASVGVAFTLGLAAFLAHRRRRSLEGGLEVKIQNRVDQEREERSGV